MTLSEIRQDARYQISPQLSSTEYPDVDLDRNINNWYRTIVGWITPLLSDWELGGDVLYNDFSRGVSDYELPKEIFRIIKGECKYQNDDGVFVPITFKSYQKEQGIAVGNLDNDTDDENSPEADLLGNVLTVTPAPDETVINGLKIWVQMDLLELEDDGDIPEFVSPIQRVLSYGSALDYALAEEMENKVLALKRMIYGDARVPNDRGLKGTIEDLYTVRSGAKRGRLKARNKTSYK